MLTGPIYMSQVYDRVLGSRSETTLIALTMLVAFFYGMMGLLDFERERIMWRFGANFQARIDRRVLEAFFHKSAIVKDDRSAAGLRDLEAVQRLQTLPILLALSDIP